MLRKLLKHEFRATGRIMLPMYLIVLAAAAGGNLSVRMMNHSDNRVVDILAALLMMAFVVAMIGVAVMTLVVMVQRFRRNLMGDEGYIMFTLPVSVHQHLWSKFITSAVWFVATGAVMLLSMLIMVLDVQVVEEMANFFRQLWREITGYYALNSAAIVGELVLLALISSAVICLQFYAAMAVGHSFANHKVAWSVVFFFVMQFVVQFLGTMGLSNSYLFSGWSGQLDLMMELHSLLWTAIGVSVITGAVYYIITAYFLKKHLNLE